MTGLVVLFVVCFVVLAGISLWRSLTGTGRSGGSSHHSFPGGSDGGGSSGSWDGGSSSGDCGGSFDGGGSAGGGDGGSC
ncbi:hypothetical protein [Kineococcus sp. R86509]|uniref:hypothetical protein n=1 Tax=Kineococcus sp. R86509 TaxID=3093851 RepID=UPI0036D219B2